jgi:predicted ATPase/class 3 adenylate cyclase
MAELPTGTVTFLFTDIEGSTTLLQRLGGDAYDRVQEKHADILRRAITRQEGSGIRTEGDSFFAVFASPVEAIRAAVAGQRELAAHRWPEDAAIRVRMGIHTGEGRLGGEDYVGIDVNRAARIAAAGHGGQVLLSDATRALVEHDLPPGVVLRDLGFHRLKDLAHPEHLFDIAIDGTRSDFPPPKTLDARPNNLPLQLTSFVGRDTDIAETVRLLGEHRLVTLTGPGGTGKTRLGLAVAAELLPSLPDGAFFVDLAPIADPGQVCPAICQVLGVREEPGSDLIDTMVSRLAGQKLLLLLDNFEHLLPAASVVDKTLARAADVRVLVTSRTPLRLYGEQECHVPPLALPDPRHPPEPEVLPRYEAVALFIDRARGVRTDFEVTSQNAPAVAEICARLDGLPLAIELAASRVKLLAPDAILSRLGRRLDLLTAGARNLPERQRTLRAAIEWSYELLDEPERRLFARLSVLAGGAGLESIEAVANPAGDLGVDTLDGLGTLVDHSLVRQIEADGGEPRFGLLETVREYAGERLDAEWDGEATRRRHADHFFALAEASEPHLTAEDQADWLDRLDRDHENLQAAFRWAIDTGEVEPGMRAAAAVWRFWHQRGHLTGGRTWLEGFLDSTDGVRADIRAKAHGAAGSLAYWQADYQGTEQHYEESLAIYRELEDRQGIADALYNLAFVPIARGTALDRAVALLEEAREMYEELADAGGVSRAKADTAYVFMMQGKPAVALPLLLEAAERSRKLGDLFRLSDDLIAVGQAHRLLGNHAEARRAYLEGLDILERGDIPAGIATVVQMMASLESALGRHERAMRMLGAAEAIQESIGASHPHDAAMLGDPIGAARTTIGGETADRALAEGRAMTREEAVAYARSADD